MASAPMHMEKDEAYLIAEFRKGKTPAFEQIFRRYYGTICYFAQDLVSDPDVAKDVVSEAFIKLWGLREEFENLRAIKAFLYITARNNGLNHLRRVRMMSDHHKVLSGEFTQEELTETMMQRIFDAEVLREVYRALETLPAQCKRVLRLTLEGLNTDDIAAALDLSAQTVRNTRVRAMDMLRKKLAHCAVGLSILTVLVESGRF